MGATYFLMKAPTEVAAEMASHVLAYNLTRMMNIVGKSGLIAGHPRHLKADRAFCSATVRA